MRYCMIKVNSCILAVKVCLCIDQTGWPPELDCDLREGPASSDLVLQMPLKSCHVSWPEVVRIATLNFRHKY
eukprot:5443707-Amphidinium_carterae.1